MYIFFFIIKISYEFCGELLTMFPNSQFAKRGANHELREVIKIAKEREFTDLIIVNEDHKVPSMFIIIVFQHILFFKKQKQKNSIF